MTKVDTDSWQNLFYYLTLASALLFNMNDSIFQGAFGSLIGAFPEKYMSALTQGDDGSKIINVQIKRLT